MLKSLEDVIPPLCKHDAIKCRLQMNSQIIQACAVNQILNQALHMYITETFYMFKVIVHLGILFLEH